MNVGINKAIVTVSKVSVKLTKSILSQMPRLPDDMIGRVNALGHIRNGRKGLPVVALVEVSGKLYYYPLTYVTGLAKGTDMGYYYLKTGRWSTASTEVTSHWLVKYNSFKADAMDTQIYI